MVKSFQDPGEYDAMVSRIDQLSNTTTAQWGRMDVAQMLAHCAEVQEVMNGTKELKNTPLMLRIIKGMVRKAVVNKVPYKKKSGTHPQYIKSKTTPDFDQMKNELLAALSFDQQLSQEEAEAIVHPLFGKMTQSERGIAGWKHMDHHLRQFDV